MATILKPTVITKQHIVTEHAPVIFATSTCGFCHSKPSAYTCPRCHARYCSAECYQHERHAQCSEPFYKEQVMEELQQMKGSSQDKTKMLNTLMKMAKADREGKSVSFQEAMSNDVTDGENDSVSSSNIVSSNITTCSNNTATANDDLEQRLANVNLNDFDDTWARLTDEEKRRFETQVKTGDMDFVEAWKPWWGQKIKTNPKIVDVSTPPSKRQKTSPKGEYPIKLPNLLKELPSLADLLPKKPPNPCLRFSIINLCGAYAFTQRLYNGEWYDTGDEVLETLLLIGKCLTENQLYDNVESCLVDFVTSVRQQKELIQNLDPVTFTLQDVANICREDFVTRVLCEMHRYISRCRRACKREQGDSEDREAKQTRNKLARINKKLEFFAAFAVEHRETLTAQRDEVLLTRSRLMQEQKLLAMQTDLVQSQMENLKPKQTPPTGGGSGGGKLIEEIN